MKTSSWNWITPRPAGLSKFGPRWLNPMAVAIPWITVILLFLMLYIVSGTMTSAKGVIFELPEGDQLEGSASPLVALVVPSAHDTLVFFDDARYSLGDRESVSALSEHLSSRTSKLEDRTLVVMADRRVQGGEIARLASVARTGGITRLLLASKQREDTDE